jgi:hypothetical protein
VPAVAKNEAPAKPQPVARPPTAAVAPAQPIPNQRPAAGMAPTPARVAPTEPRKPARRSRPDIVIGRSDGETTQQTAMPAEARKRGRSSRPPAQEVTPKPAPADAADAWPTQNLTADDLEDPQDEKTRVGAPAYMESATTTTSAPPPPPAPAASNGTEPALKAAQAVRVVVWRSADGVHVAPHGTTVSAISLDAMLVALDPSADLAAWLTKK